MLRSLVLLLAGVAPAIAQTDAGRTDFFTATDVAALLAMTVAAVGCGLAQSNVLAKGVESIARQPEAAGKIQGVLLIGLGFIESMAIYVLVIALIIIFANPAATAVAH